MNESGEDDDGEGQIPNEDEDDCIFGIQWDDGPRELNTLGGGVDVGRARTIKFTAVVGSGAAESGIPKGLCEFAGTEPTRRSLAGIGFRGAGG